MRLPLLAAVVVAAVGWVRGGGVGGVGRAAALIGAFRGWVLVHLIATHKLGHRLSEQRGKRRESEERNMNNNDQQQ